MTAAVRAEGVEFAFTPGEPVLCGAALEVAAGEVVAVRGRSGSGKSTFLLCLAGILAPQAGRIEIAGRDLTVLDDDGRSAVRRTSLGFVFQFGELVAELDLLGNVALPLELLGVRRSRAARHAGALLDELGLGPLARRRPGEVSGGQAQRAAVARALVHRPAVVLADEPTGSLDEENAATVLDALVGLAVRRSAALVLVTHDDRVAERASRSVTLVDGAVTDAWSAR
ncbi:MAG: putative transport system ATP-binding protein [Actinomycetota bacterium]|nr:putative transport system ATP-binding protein [Actinomycetota bacterium]